MGGRGKLISAPDRQQAIELIDEAVKSGAKQSKACRLLNLTDRTYRNWKAKGKDGGVDGRTTRVQHPANALMQEERSALISRLNQPDVADLSVPQAFRKLIDNGEYYGSERTIYRVLKEAGLNKRRDATRLPNRRYKPSSYEATGPNQVWTWDITYLRDGKHKGQFFYAYVIVDVYSRYVVHSEVYDSDCAAFAQEFLTKALIKHCIKPNSLVLHSDNGASMKAVNTLALLENMGVERSHSRPRVSDDNPYSEALFRTLKYTGRLPAGGFNGIEHARTWLASFVDNYNHHRYHSGINWVTPASRFEGNDKTVLAKRKQVIERARSKHPNRWIGNRTLNCEPAPSQWLNPDRSEKTTV